MVIEGKAPGTDTLAAAAGRQLGILVLPFPADSEKHGRVARPTKNREMVAEGHPDLGLAVSEDFAPSRGVADMQVLLVSNLGVGREVSEGSAPNA